MTTIQSLQHNNVRFKWMFLYVFTLTIWFITIVWLHWQFMYCEPRALYEIRIETLHVICHLLTIQLHSITVITTNCCMMCKCVWVWLKLTYFWKCVKHLIVFDLFSVLNTQTMIKQKQFFNEPVLRVEPSIGW